MAAWTSYSPDALVPADGASLGGGGLIKHK